MGWLDIVIIKSLWVMNKFILINFNFKKCNLVWFLDLNIYLLGYFNVDF